MMTIFLMTTFLLTQCNTESPTKGKFEEGFINPSRENRPLALWAWLNGYVDTTKLVFAYFKMALLYDQADKHLEALEAFLHILDLAVLSNDSVSIVDACNGIGIIHKKQGNLDLATSIYTRGLKVAKAQKDSIGIGHLGGGGGTKIQPIVTINSSDGNGANIIFFSSTLFGIYLKAKTKKAKESIIPISRIRSRFFLKSKRGFLFINKIKPIQNVIK